MKKIKYIWQLGKGRCRVWVYDFSFSIINFFFQKKKLGKQGIDMIIETDNQSSKANYRAVR